MYAFRTHSRYFSDNSECSAFTQGARASTPHQRSAQGQSAMSASILLFLLSLQYIHTSLYPPNKPMNEQFYLLVLLMLKRRLLPLPTGGWKLVLNFGNRTHWLHCKLHQMLETTIFQVVLNYLYNLTAPAAQQLSSELGKPCHRSSWPIKSIHQMHCATFFFQDLCLDLLLQNQVITFLHLLKVNFA